MNEQVLERIDALAAKFGVVGEHLWEVLIRQAYIYGAMSIIHVAVVGVLAWLFFRYVLPWAENGYEERGLVAFVTGLCLSIWALIAVLLMFDGVGYLFNPEYFALTRILP